MELATAATDDAGVGRELLVGAVLGLSSPIDPATGDANPRVLKSWAASRFRETLAHRLGTPVQVENDANLEAWAEVTLGAGQGLRHALSGSFSEALCRTRTGDPFLTIDARGFSEIPAVRTVHRFAASHSLRSPRRAGAFGPRPAREA